MPKKLPDGHQSATGAIFTLGIVSGLGSPARLVDPCLGLGRLGRGSWGMAGSDNRLMERRRVGVILALNVLVVADQRICRYGPSVQNFLRFVLITDVDIVAGSFLLRAETRTISSLFTVRMP